MAQAPGSGSRPQIEAAVATADRVGLAQLKTKVWFEIEGRFVLGDGGLRLLQGIRTHGSLLGAAREMGWSYRHAWGYLKRAEQAFGAALTVARAGKGASRGMTLTESGCLLAERLAEYRRRIDDAVGPSGPTVEEVAQRGAPRSAPRRAKTQTVRRFRDGDWRSPG